MNVDKILPNLTGRFWCLVATIYNCFINLFDKKQILFSDLKEFNEIINYAKKRTDINDHLIILFTESLLVKPKMIIELGVRGGESHYILERVARLCNSLIVSVDIDDCSRVGSYKKWYFVRSDDIEFAKEYESWCLKKGFDPTIDILFIDTSHLYQHTIDEINSWFPFLSEKAKVLLHDTNMNKIFFRKDGSMGMGWDNNRGVIKALEEYLHTSFDETNDFVTIMDGWLIKHYSCCNGFTILQRMPHIKYERELLKNNVDKASDE